MGARVPDVVAPVDLCTDAVACVGPNPPLVLTGPIAAPLDHR
ncbi:MAG: hypothetical protein ABR528_13310 [Pseudonocardiaceae bacterium]